MRCLKIIRERISELPVSIVAGLALLAINAGLVLPEPLGAAGATVARALEYNRTAILDGEHWRILTGNLVHWSREHFLLDLGALLAIGALFEARLGRRYLVCLLGSGLGVGLALLAIDPSVEVYRGLSGIDSGIFAVALAMELRSDQGRFGRTATLAAALVFAVKLIFECVSGGLFLPTAELGELGLPTPLAHAAGCIAGLASFLFTFVASPASRRYHRALV